jgi:hypothetical protein
MTRELNELTDQKEKEWRGTILLYLSNSQPYEKLQISFAGLIS